MDAVSDTFGAGGAPARAAFLLPYVEILLATGQTESAILAADELQQVAVSTESSLLTAAAAQARGMTRLARNQPGEALADLRRAWMLWQQLACPHESARVRVWLAQASDALGDRETARRHRDAARKMFERLHAAPDLAALDRPASHPLSDPNFSLSRREREILARLAQGATNRQIAVELAISQHTVARHVSNIFDKLGVNTRTAASALAHANRLLAGSTGQN
jgi:DNA-binding CsgD family transcriptional regulator